MLGIQRFTTVVALQGEIGASTLKSRDMKSKLKIVKHMKTTENGLLFGDQDKKKIEKRKKYLEDLWRERIQQVQLRCEEETRSGEV